MLRIHHAIMPMNSFIDIVFTGVYFFLIFAPKSKLYIFLSKFMFSATNMYLAVVKKSRYIVKRCYVKI